MNTFMKIDARWLRAANSISAGIAAALLFAGSAAAQQEWPVKPVKIVVAVGPGSSGDILARILAPRLDAMWKQPVIVENRPGASGVIGTEYVVTATDGHTLLFGSQSSLLPKFTSKNLRFDPLTDLVPVYKFINYQACLVTNAPTAQKAKTLGEFAALSKSIPQGLFFSGMGQTSLFNLSMAILNKTLGMKYSAVDFSNVGAMNIAVMRNDAQFLVNTPSSVKPQIDAGALHALAVINEERYPNMPDVPTLREAVGYKGYLPLWWAGVFVPKNTPRALVDRLGRDFLALATDPELKKLIESRLTGSVVRSSPAAYAKEIAEEANVWKDLFASMNYKPE